VVSATSGDKPISGRAMAGWSRAIVGVQVDNLLGCIGVLLSRERIDAARLAAWVVARRTRCMGCIEA